MRKLITFIKKQFSSIEQIHKNKAISDLEWEIQELKHVFAVMSMGAFIGQPGSPLPVTFALLPDMKNEFAILLSKIKTADSPLSEHFSKLDAI